MEDWKNHLTEICGSLLCPSTPQDETEQSLEEFRSVLSRCALEDIDGVDSIKEFCFTSGLVKALLGILRSSSQTSMLVVTCKCVSLLAHESGQSIDKLGEMGCIRVLIDLLHHHSSRETSNGSKWSRKSVPVYEQVMTCLRKLTFYSVANQLELARIGAIKMIVSLATDKGVLSNFKQFSEEVKECLEVMTVRKKFISRVVAVSNDEKREVLSSFSSISSSPLAHNYPVFYVDLYNKDKTAVSREMVKEGLVWPAEEEALSGSCKWTFLLVQAVEDGNSFWCHFCHKNLSQSLLEMKEALDAMDAPVRNGSGQLCHPKLEPVSNPVMGETYLSHFPAPVTSDLKVSGEVPCHQWFRVRTVAITSSHVKVLAIDFGFSTELPMEALFALTKQCRGIPPQAIPCRLRGVAPAPASISIMKNCAAIIRNMSFEREAFCKEIKNFKGVEAMIKFAECCQREVVVEALGALVNLIVVECLREYIGSQGALELALGLLRNSDDGEVMKWSMGILLNGLTDCRPNVALFKKLNGISILESINWEEAPAMERENLRNWADEIRTVLSRSSSELKEDASVRRSDASLKHLKSKRSLTEFRRLVNGERSNSRPVVHYLDSKYKPTVSSFKCNGNYINICRNGAKALVDNSQCSLRSSRKSCRINQMRADQLAPVKKGTAKPSARVLLMGAKVFSNLKFSGTVVLLSVSDISDFPKYGIKRSVCSIMNGQNGGSVLLGVNSQGIVQGFKIDRSQKDAFFLGFDGMMTSEVIPPVLSDQYEVMFHSLAFPPTSMSPRSDVIPGYHVVEIRLRNSPGRVVYTVTDFSPGGFKCNRCYVRTPRGINLMLNYQELRDHIARLESRKYHTLFSSSSRKPF